MYSHSSVTAQNITFNDAVSTIDAWYQELVRVEKSIADMGFRDGGAAVREVGSYTKQVDRILRLLRGAGAEITASRGESYLRVVASVALASAGEVMREASDYLKSKQAMTRESSRLYVPLSPNASPRGA